MKDTPEILNTNWGFIWNKVKPVRLSKRPHMFEEEEKANEYF